MPNPLRLEIVLSCGHGLGKLSFNALALVGNNVLQLLFSLVVFLQHPYMHARELESRVQHSKCEDRLVELVTASGILAEALPDATDNQPAARTSDRPTNRLTARPT